MRSIPCQAKQWSVANVCCVYPLLFSWCLTKKATATQYFGPFLLKRPRSQNTWLSVGVDLKLGLARKMRCESPFPYITKLLVYGTKGKKTKTPLKINMEHSGTWSWRIGRSFSFLNGWWLGSIWFHVNLPGWNFGRIPSISSCPFPTFFGRSHRKNSPQPW